MRKLIVALFSACIVAGVLATWTVQAKQRSQGMPQIWEYKSVIIARPVEANSQFTNWWEIDTRGRQTLPGTPDSLAKLNELGAQGWELVSVTAVSNHAADPRPQTGITPNWAGFTSQITYWFKRPKQ